MSKARKRRKSLPARKEPAPLSQGAAALEPPKVKLAGWKKALFAVVTVTGFFGLLEIALGALGVEPALTVEDPYVGFASNIPLFAETRGPDGQTYLATAQNKVRWFNRQRFLKEKPKGTYRIFSLGGSTTYGRPYDDKASFSGWLREILSAAAPDRDWEVINAGGISYASYRVALLMEELVEYDPDLFLIYSGHNEFLEKRTYSDISEAPRLLAETGGLLSRTRLYAAARKALHVASERPAADVLGAEVDTILEHSVGPSQYHRDDEWRADVIAHYRFNLERMIQIARSSGARVVLITPASNLSACAPFKSEHAAGLDREEKSAVQEYLAAARASLDAGLAQSALESLNAALSIDNRYADLHYRRGEALVQVNRFDEAKAAYERALDEDVCPLRILPSMRQILAEVAAKHDVPLVDFARFIERRADHGIPGNDAFLDHVHLHLDGYRLLALELLDRLASLQVARTSPSWNEEALAAVSARVEARIDEKEEGVALRNLAKVLDWAGKQEEAERLARQAAEMLGEDAESLNILGRAAAARGDFDEAIRHFEQALRRKPGYIAPLAPLGIALGKIGRQREAIGYFRAAIEGRPDFAEAHYNLGSALMDLGQIPAAIDSFENALRHDPRHAPTYNNLGIALASAGRLEDALERYRQALEINPNYTEARLNLGLALQAQGDQAEGERQLELALEANPESPEALVNVGNAALATGRTAEAIGLYEQALALAPESSQALYNLGNALLQGGRAAEAEKRYRQALKTGPDSAELRSNLGKALLALGSPQEAAREYRRALELRPESAEGHFNLAAALGAQDRTTAAEEQYRKALEIRPDYAEAHSNLANLLLASAQTEAALDHYARAVALKPRFPAAHYNYGMALGLSGRVDEAIRHFRLAIEQQPNYPEAHHYLATSLEREGRYDEALEHLRQAARLRPDWAPPLSYQAWILATRRPDQSKVAVQLAQRAAELTGRRDPFVLDALGAAYAASGDFTKAAAAASRAVQLLRSAGATQDARAIERRLALYRRSQPYRASSDGAPP